MHPVETYLAELRDSVLSKGVAETSGYTGLANLINEVGRGLKPEVKAVIHPRGSTLEGIPDGAFFTKDEFRDETDSSLLMRLQFDESRRPKRGYLEVKSVAEDLEKTIQSPQVRKYLDAVPYLVVTNYWDFRLLSLVDGQLIEGERFTLAPDEGAFREAIRKPRNLAKDQGARFLDFLQRALIHEAPLDAPKDLAWYLASYAREALARIELHADAAHLEQLRKSMEEALGISFRDAEGEHFFRSSLVQTLFYGLFAAWVLWCQAPKRREGDVFRWQEGIDHLHVPAISAIYHQIQDRAKLRALDLVPVLEWTAQVLNRMNREAFFKKFRQDHAVQYFYEPFLQAFDPDLRK